MDFHIAEPNRLPVPEICDYQREVLDDGRVQVSYLTRPPAALQWDLVTFIIAASGTADDPRPEGEDDRS